MIQQQSVSSLPTKSPSDIVRSSGVILLYHRVVDLPSDPQLLCVTPTHFEQHLRVLRDRYSVGPLESCVEQSAHGTSAKQNVVITFDDGYADNLKNAKPLLDRFECPATVFVTARRERCEREFWWDELERLLLEHGDRPQSLRLCLSGESFEWDLGSAATYSLQDAKTHADWNVLAREDPTPRHALYRALCGKLRLLPNKERNRLIDELCAWAGTPTICRVTHRSLTDDQIGELADGGLIEIGAHTITHSVLAEQSVEAQRTEISESKARLERITGTPIRSFSYPFGGKQDYTTDTCELVREAGFSRACANFGAPIDRQTDPFQLPRHIVRDCDGPTFAAWIEAWFSGE